ncbi:GNAT family N-acetyltransferase [Lewinella cohaerens]|uniref:GNAT family N-acetyltransferase n=1 Tax=Lewinella cohaerens TaxID=70995 RepID=UPI00037CEF46|nr:N-acetyltransferase [Lewinella cohaerens]
MIDIRPEKPADSLAVKTILQRAFANNEHSDQTEDLLVERLRKSPAYIPELALVATLEKKVVGHILLTKIDIVSNDGSTPSLALAPVSVHPDYQNRGFGGSLIKAAHQQARQLGYGSIVLLGHADYYPRFGYKLCRDYGIELPFQAPAENCMVVELHKGALTGVNGMVKYAPAFFE